MAIPRIMGHRNYKKYLEERNRFFEKRSNTAYKKLKDLDGVIANKANGAFYMSVVFEDNYLNGNNSIKIENEKLKEFIEHQIKDASIDKKFVYYLLASTGICVVPLTSFCSQLNGFRVTLLERDDEKFEWIFDTLAEKIDEFLKT